MTSVPRNHFRHALKSLYDWLDANVGGGAVPDPAAAPDGMVLTVSSGAYSLVAPSYPLFVPISEADLLAHKTTYLNAGFNGYAIVAISVAVQKDVTTGGTVKLKVGGVDVVGSTVTVQNGDTAGTLYSAVLIDSSADVGLASVVSIEIQDFATAGAVNVTLQVASVRN